jgi:CelD/BcsL family acetyltransferase involved in cellulose biosynthesis
MSYLVSPDSLEGLESVRNQYKDKLKWPLFVLPDWLKVWTESFGARGDEPYIRTIRQDGDIIGVAPLIRRGDTVFFIGDTSVCDYEDFVTAPGREEGFCCALLDDLEENSVRELDLAHLRPDSAAMTALAPLAERRGLTVSRHQESVSYEMDLPKSFDEYIESLTAKQRHEVRRKMRRMGESGNVAYRSITSGAGVVAVMDKFFQMFVESRRDKAEFMTERMKSYFIRLADAMAKAGLLNLGILELDSRPVAQVMSFDYNSSIYLYNSGYDPEYTSLSAGLLSKVMAIKESIERGKACFDFLKGAEVYKGHLGGREVPLYRCKIALK